MNQRTSRLLLRFSTATKRGEKDLKRWWRSMTHAQRGAARQMLQSTTGGRR